HISSDFSVVFVNTLDQPPDYASKTMLHITSRKSGKETDTDVRFAVAVGVLRIENLRSRGHQDAFSPRHHAGGKREVVQEERGLVVLAGSLRVLEEFDTSARLAFAVQ